MKSITLLASLLIAFTFFSCKKDRVCNCTTTNLTTGAKTDTKTIYFDSRKKDARVSCMANATQTETTSPTAISPTSKKTCELK